MATKKKSQVEKIKNVLTRHTKGAGISASSISRIARVPYDSVSKRVHDLREMYNIYTNYRNVNGKRVTYYRLAD